MAHFDPRRMPLPWGPDTRKDWASGKKDMTERPHGCGIMLFWAALVSWWLTLIGSVVAWVLILSGVGKMQGLRLFGRLPGWAFPLLPGLRFVDDLEKTIHSIELEDYEPRPLVIRVIYAALIGWWLSALLVLAAWALMMTLFAIPAAQQLHCLVPRVATLARYDVPWR